jgi:hypothetical protein
MMKRNSEELAAIEKCELSLEEIARYGLPPDVLFTIVLLVWRAAMRFRDAHPEITQSSMYAPDEYQKEKEEKVDA